VDERDRARDHVRGLVERLIDPVGRDAEQRCDQTHHRREYEAALYAERRAGRVPRAKCLRNQRVHRPHQAEAEVEQTDRVQAAERGGRELARRDVADEDRVDHVHEHEAHLHGGDRDREAHERPHVVRAGDEGMEHVYRITRSASARQSSMPRRVVRANASRSHVRHRPTRAMNARDVDSSRQVFTHIIVAALVHASRSRNRFAG